MAYLSKNRWVDYSIFGLSVFLIFCLLFEANIELPVLVAWGGRWHPLILHFPIVLLLISIFLGLTGKNIPRKLLTVAVVSALITAISGFFLGKESVIKGDLLFWHQWLGGGMALLSAIWYWLQGLQLERTIYTKALQLVLLLLIGATGHYGGMVTHGEDFLALPTPKNQDKIPDNPLIYEHVVGRILENKCVSCHNPNKQKGELVMNSLDGLIKGGEVGNTIVPGDSEKSELIRRLHLPQDDDEHMPPEGKKPLSDTEIGILERWIALGSSDTMRLEHFESSEPLVALVKELMEPDPMEKWVHLPKIADSTLQHLSSDYLTIDRVANNSDALRIVAYLPPEYNPEYILALSRVALNIVELDFSGLPIGAQEIEMVASCVNLEWLELDRTPISDSEIDALKTLSKLRLLKVYHTSIGDSSIQVFQKLENLRRLYLWETNISQQALAELKLVKSGLLVNDGITEELKLFFAASDSIAKE
ncbi:MAG: hypothetical protein QM485_11990 [Flavobacteriaceae bacterium]